MSNVTTLFHEAAFDPETVETLCRAYDMACKSLHDKGQPAIVQEIIAKRIIAAARRGERSPEKLCESALTSLGNKAVFG
jgi:hypothetical protein